MRPDKFIPPGLGLPVCCSVVVFVFFSLSLLFCLFVWGGLRWIRDDRAGYMVYERKGGEGGGVATR